MRIPTYLMGLLLLAGACSTDTNTKNTAAAQPMVGADTDEHGCKGAAGYQWSAVQQKCVQLSAAAIKLDAGEGPVAYLLFASFDEDGQAEVFLPGQPGRVLAKVPGEGAGTWTLDTLTLTQWKGMYTLSGPTDKVLYEGHANTDEAMGDVGQTG